MKTTTPTLVSDDAITALGVAAGDFVRARIEVHKTMGAKGIPATIVEDAQKKIMRKFAASVRAIGEGILDEASKKAEPAAK